MAEESFLPVVLDGLLGVVVILSLLLQISEEVVDSFQVGISEVNFS